jgi:aldose 1-epimerase
MPITSTFRGRSERVTGTSTYGSRLAQCVLLLAWCLIGIGYSSSATAADKRPFGVLADGRQVDLYTLTNKHGMVATVMNYGAALVSLKVPDRDGKLDDVVVGWDNLNQYVKNKNAGGTIDGRHAGYISKASYTLDGVEVKLSKNAGQNHIHGGFNGFATKYWTARDASDKKAQRVEFTYFSPDGEEGYPGNLTTKVTYTVTDKNELEMNFDATTDKDTVVNLMNHAYLNLTGVGKGTIMDNVLQINADQYGLLDASHNTSGELRSVEGTPFDFRKPAVVGERMKQDDEQIKLAKGFDHNFVIKGGGKGKIVPAARLYDPQSGRVMEVLTTQTVLLFYSGQKSGTPGSLFSMEVQHMPDAPNKPNLPTTILRAGKHYHETTILRFSVEPAKSK